MLFFFPLILTAGMIVTAAITFTVCTAITPLWKFAITPPAASPVVSPILLLLSYQTWITIHHIFIVRNSMLIPMWAYWIIEFLAVIFFIVLAFAFTLFCRVVLEYGPPFLTRSFGLKPLLLIQTVLLVGTLASALVNLVLFATLVRAFEDNITRVVGFSGIGLIVIGICIRPLFHLDNPRRYAPKALPEWLKQRFFVSATS
jgi:hypothetical protein